MPFWIALRYFDNEIYFFVEAIFHFEKQNKNLFVIFGS